MTGGEVGGGEVVGGAVVGVVGPVVVGGMVPPGVPPVALPPDQVMAPLVAVLPGPTVSLVPSEYVTVSGAAVTFDAFRLAFTRVIRSREYKTQGKESQFGAVDLTFRF